MALGLAGCTSSVSGLDTVGPSFAPDTASLSPLPDSPNAVPTSSPAGAPGFAETASSPEAITMTVGNQPIAPTGVVTANRTTGVIADPNAPFPDAPGLTVETETASAETDDIAAEAEADLDVADAEVDAEIEATAVANAAPEAETIAVTGSTQLALAAAPAQPTVSNRSPVGQNLFRSLFGKRPQNTVSRPQPSAVVADQRVAQATQTVAAAAAPATALVATAPAPTATVSAASATAAPRQVMTALPGVRPAGTLFSLNSDDGSAAAKADKPVQLASASAAGLARLAPNGIRKQTDRVQTECFKPELIRVLQRIERHYNKPVVVTSGYRSPNGNRNAGGSSKSLHMYCAAADIQVAGVSKWELAKYIRSMPGRGGVGTYCHTESVHVDIGSKRDWNWRCRRR